MKNHISYRSYNDNEPFIFLSFDKADREIAAGIINNLVERRFRICYDEHNSETISDCEWLANRIMSSALAVFLISADSLGSLELRNCINFALSKKKKVLCIHLDEKQLDYGFDMQLAQIPSVQLNNYVNAVEFCEDVIKAGYFSQDMRGDDAKAPIKKRIRKKDAILAIVAVFIMFSVAAVLTVVYRINYDNSFIGQIEKLTEADYLDISNVSASTINLLKDKSIRTLVASDMGLTDIEALRYVNCEELDISRNPEVLTLEPLLENANLKIVKVTQDMYPAIVRLAGRNQFKIIITG